MTTVELPYEIWLHILRFLNTETIGQLRFVSTLFYNLSLNEHHRITQIGDPGHRYASLRCVNSGS
jgi:hypothetical protein